MVGVSGFGIFGYAILAVVPTPILVVAATIGYLGG